MRARAAPAQADRVRRSLPALAAVLAAGSVYTSAGPAAADAVLAPGSVQTAVIDVPDDWEDEAMQVDVTVGTLVEAENSCLDPEVEAGDGCSTSEDTSDTGELARQLTSTVAWGVHDPDGVCQPITEADAVPLALVLDETAELRGTAGAMGVDCLLFELTFGHRTDNNLAQSDTVDIPLTLVARDLADPVEIDAAGTDRVETHEDGTEQGSDSGLATRGADDSVRNETARSATAREPDGAAVVPGGAGAVAAAPAAPLGPAGEVIGQTPAGPVLDRVDARVGVDGDGVTVQTQAAGTSIQGLVLMWGSLLLGGIAMGWAGFVLVARRRKRSAA
jgi:hypothetical protein